ncbi:MAG: hypothetical protein Q4B86_03125 [Eubacteriales bacterium]|nr:hypothetical protein [Eubacteriales bacterium]
MAAATNTVTGEKKMLNSLKKIKKSIAGLLTMAFIISLCIPLFDASVSLASYNDTNLNTFIHNGSSIPEGEAGLPMTIRFRFGYNGEQGLYNPESESIKSVDVRLSNDQTYMGVQVKVGENSTAFKERLEKILGYELESEDELQKYLDGYNAGYSDAGNGTILYNFPVESGSYPFEVDSNLFAQKVHFDEVKKGEYKEVEFQVTVRKDTKEGYYAIPVQFEYQLPDVAYVGRPHPTKVEYINVYIKAASSESSGNKVENENQFVVGENQMTPYGTYPQVMNYSVNFRNQRETVYDVTVRINTKLGDKAEMKKTAPAKSIANTGYPFDINETNYDRNFPEVARDQVITVDYSMAISSYSASGFYPLSYTVSYRKVPNGTLYQENHEAYVRIRNASMEDKNAEQTDGEWNANTATKARLIVEGYTTVPEKVFAGDSFELKLKIKNASENIDASNILLTFVSEETQDKSAIFSTESGANSFVINSLPAGQTEEMTIVYNSKAGIDQGTYKITIKERYDSPEFKNADEEVAVNIPVYQIARLSTSSFEVMPSSVEVGSESNVMFGINNTGKVVLHNVSVTFKSDSIKENTSYIGNIKPGETGNVDAMLQGIAPTADDGKVTAVISYEDENGKVTTEEKTFELYVSEPVMDMGDQMMTDMPAEDEQNMANPVLNWIKDNIFLTVIGGLLAVVVLLVVIKKVKKNRIEKEMQKEDEEI